MAKWDHDDFKPIPATAMRVAQQEVVRRYEEKLRHAELRHAELIQQMVTGCLPPDMILKPKPSPSPLEMVAMRMRWGEHPFDCMHAHVGADEVILFLVVDGKPITMTDGKGLFPSDALITQLRLLPQRSKGEAA